MCQCSPALKVNRRGVEGFFALWMCHSLSKRGPDKKVLKIRAAFIDTQIQSVAGSGCLRGGGRKKEGHQQQVTLSSIFTGKAS